MLEFGEDINEHLQTLSENRIKILNSISEEELNQFLEVATKEDKLLLDFKDLEENKLCTVFKYAMKHDDRSSPLITLNLFNLLKTYNNLEESFFNSQDIYFNNTVELVDIKVELDIELKEFLRNFSIYFLSLIKSYNKLIYSPLETVKQLPILYQVLFSMMDFGTAAGIFSYAPDIATTECLPIEDAYKFLNLMLIKTGMSINFLANFFNEGKVNGD